MWYIDVFFLYVLIFAWFNNMLLLERKLRNQNNYSALPNKHTIMLINFCKIGNAVLLLLGAVW